MPSVTSISFFLAVPIDIEHDVYGTSVDYGIVEAISVTIDDHT
jgi:hypothetical protein